MSGGRESAVAASAVVDWALALRFEDLPNHVVLRLKRHVVDTLGVAVAASRTDLSRIVRNHAHEHFGGGAAALWQDGRRASLPGAALANAMTTDALDAHDGHKITKGHVGCATVAAVLALAEGADGRETLVRAAIGYEVGTRAGIAMHRTCADYHTSGASMAPAVALVAARALDLTREQAREAAGIAEYHGPRSPMMRCIDHPTMVKDGSGWGAMAGTSAALLARDGFTGAPAALLEDEAVRDLWHDLGSSWRVHEQYVKLYPVCRWAQPAVEGALALMRAHGLSGGDVAGVEVETFHEAVRLASLPDTTEEAQYSLPFPVACAVLRGTVGVEEVTQALRDPTVRDLAARVAMRRDDAFDAAFPERRLARVTLLTHDGRRLVSGDTQAQGDPEAPLSDAAMRAKFDALARPVLGERADELFEAVDTLDTDPRAHGRVLAIMGAATPL